MVLALRQVLKRLLTTLACLGVTHVHITGAEKVELVYYGATALLPHNILPQLITGTISSHVQLPEGSMHASPCMLMQSAL